MKTRLLTASSLRASLLLCCLLMALVAAQGSRAEPQAAPPSQEPSLELMLQQLTAANLRESLQILTELEEAGGAQMLPLFEAMLEGDLHYDPATFAMLALSDKGGRQTVTNVLSGEVLRDVDASALQKIRVNNRIRGHLHDAIARINLLQGEPAQRKKAARQMLENFNAGNLTLMQTALQQEQNGGVRQLLEAAIALQVLVSDADRDSRLAALQTLDGRLESSVRNTLGSMLDELGRNEQDPEIRSAAAAALQKIESKVRFFSWIDQVFFGLSLGSVLLLAAVGLAVTFGVMGVINMAHGEMLMLGAYTTYVVQMAMPAFVNYSIWLAIPAAFLVAASVGILIQRFVIRHLVGRPIETLLATFGISLILQQAVRSIFSPLNRRVMSPDWMSGSIEINPVLSLTANRFSILIFSLIVFAVLLLIFKKTSLGLQVRAVAENRDMAKAMGIKTDRVDALTFGLGSGVAGIAGVALSQLTNVGPNLGQAYIIDSFMVVVFGGVGNLWGTFVGAFSLGVFTKFLEPEVGAVLAKILVLLMLMLFIQKRPRGLFPHKGRAAE